MNCNCGTFTLPPVLDSALNETLAVDAQAIATRPSDYHTEVALGRRAQAETWNKFGYNEDIDTGSSPEVIAAYGGTFQYITSGETLDIVSSNADDTLLGTGAQRILIWGVDENWEEQQEVVEMNGTSTVTTVTQWIGINRVAIFKAGTGAKNAGDINLKATVSGVTLAEVPTGEGTTQQMVFYVPANSQFLLEWIYFNSIKLVGGGNPEITFKGLVYSDVATAEFEIYRGELDVADSTELNITPPVPLVIGEKSILWFTGDTDSNNTRVSGRFSGELFGE